jgi:hypothetical protein
VLPVSKDSPSRLHQRRIILSVAGNVSVELLTPPLAVDYWPCGVDGAAMPKTSVYENRETRLREDDVGFAPQSGDRPAVFEEAESPPKQFAP